MRILNTKQIRELDSFTIQREPIASIDLMERASRAFVDWFVPHVDAGKKIGVVCGTGNNGGDGLAIARMLFEWGYTVKVWIIFGGVPESDDFKTNLTRLPERVGRNAIRTERDGISFEDRDVLIDAIFGSGLSRPVEGLYAKIIDIMNASDALRVAVDIPSGLMADSRSGQPVVKADYTIAFQLPKLAFLLPQNYSYIGDWKVVDIGLDKSFIRESSTNYFYTRISDVRKILRRRSKFDHKGTYGHGLLIVGSYGKMGAAVLAARGALRSGIGLLTVHIPRSGYAILQTAVPEAMVRTDQDLDVFSDVPDLSAYTTVGIGPGLGQDERTAKALGKVLERFDKPAILDADALNILGANRELLSLIPKGSILTPHPREFERITGPSKDDFERMEMQQQLAVSLGAVVVLKGAHTRVATGDGNIHFNSTGNPGMATGGTGDVLTGILTGLVAQKYSPVEAAIAGVFLHGLAGDLAAATDGMDSLIASDVVAHLPGAYLKVLRQ